MSNEDIVELAESKLKPLDHLAQLITQGKIKEVMEIIERRKKEEGIEEIKWRIAESRCRNNRGEFEQVLIITKEITKEIEELKAQMGEKERIRIDVLNEQVWALQNMGRTEEGLKKVEEGIRLLEELEGREEKDKERKANLFINKGNIYLYKGEMEKSQEYYEKSLVINEELGNKRLISLSLNNIGNIYHWRGELDHAMEYYEKSLVLREETGNNHSIGSSLNNIGLVYQKKGEMDRALENYEKCLAICEEMEYKQLIAHPLTNIGQVYYQKGELDKALEYFNKGLANFKRQGDKNHTGEVLIHISRIYHETGELAAALYFLKQCVEICEEIGSNLFMAYPLFDLITVTLDLEDIKQAKDYLSNLQQINEQEENRQVNLFSRLGEALILKRSKRRKSLTKAEEILEKIIKDSEEEIIEHQLTVLALVNLSELLLDELNSTGEEEILEEVEEKVDKLVEIAKELQSYSLLTESYLLKAQLALVRLDLIDAR
ncbi:MAG: tetratricopeptide repeat protein, partial [Candidatus Kariarchaeaceae archaeon]